jgi:predicted nucleotidyltransferase component of viral defense system
MNKNISNLHLDILDKERQILLHKLLLCYPFNDLYEYEEVDEGLRLFSVKDIAIKKAYTIGRRGEYRDYFDLYTILKREVISLLGLIRDTKKIYGSIFEEKIFLQQLVYFDDLLTFEIISANQDSITPPEVVKQFFERLVNDYTK